MIERYDFNPVCRPVQNGDRRSRDGERPNQLRRGKRPIQPHLEHADPLSGSVQMLDDFLHSPRPGPHQDDHPRRIVSPELLYRADYKLHCGNPHQAFSYGLPSPPGPVHQSVKAASRLGISVAEGIAHGSILAQG